MADIIGWIGTVLVVVAYIVNSMGLLRHAKD